MLIEWWMTTVKRQHRDFQIHQRTVVWLRFPRDRWYVPRAKNQPLMIIVILALLSDYLSRYRDIVCGAEEKRAYNSIITTGSGREWRGTARHGSYYFCGNSISPRFPRQTIFWYVSNLCVSEFISASLDSFLSIKRLLESSALSPFCYFVPIAVTREIPETRYNIPSRNFHFHWKKMSNVELKNIL